MLNGTVSSPSHPRLGFEDSSPNTSDEDHTDPRKTQQDIRWKGL